MTKLTRLFTEHGQSPWLDNLSRAYLRDGTLARYIADGVRGVTANPAIFARAIEGSAAYDRQFSALIAAGRSIADAYWGSLSTTSAARSACYDPPMTRAGGCDGFASIEVAPEIAHDTAATVAAARALHERIAEPILLVKIPATPAGVPAIQAMIAEGRSINIT
jgi:transaldolase